MKKRIWNKVVSIMTAILLVVGLVPNMTVAVMAATVENITYLNVSKLFEENIRKAPFYGVFLFFILSKKPS